MSVDDDSEQTIPIAPKLQADFKDEQPLLQPMRDAPLSKADHDLFTQLGGIPVHDKFIELIIDNIAETLAPVAWEVMKYNLSVASEQPCAAPYAGIIASTYQLEETPTLMTMNSLHRSGLGAVRNGLIRQPSSAFCKLFFEALADMTMQSVDEIFESGQISEEDGMVASAEVIRTTLRRMNYKELEQIEKESGIEPITLTDVKGVLCLSSALTTPAVQAVDPLKRPQPYSDPSQERGI